MVNELIITVSIYDIYTIGTRKKRQENLVTAAKPCRRSIVYKSQ